MSDIYLQSFAAMGTVVTLRVVGHGGSAEERNEREELAARAATWFRSVEQVCSRFDPASELSRLCRRIGAPIPVSPLLYRVTEFAMALARETDGAFDPTVGRRMEARGFNRSYRTRKASQGPIAVDESVRYEDVELDPVRQTIAIIRPLLLDLGAVAKGLAIDLAARELAPVQNYSIDAGGDLYLAGRDERGLPWCVGVRHPRIRGEIIEQLRVTDAAVCTSGDYERRSADGGHHILDPRSGASTDEAASVTVIAESAMVADGLGTAAMVLGPTEGLALLRQQAVDGLIISTDLTMSATEGMARYRVPLPEAIRQG